MILFAVSNTEMIILIAIGLLLVGLIGVGLIHYTKVKMEQELDEFATNPVEENVAEIEEDDDTYSDTDREDLEEIEVPKVEDDKKEPMSEIEILLEQMQSDLERQNKETIHTFEEEQEENSIISYQELKAMKENHNHEDEIMKYEKEQEETSVLHTSEVPHIDYDMEEEPMDLEFANKTVNQKEESKKSFSNSDFISPVYGKMDTGHLDYPKIPNFKEEFHIDHNQDEIMFDDIKVKLKDDEEPDLEHTFDLGPMSEDIKKNDEFLKALKEFRNNLE